MKRGRDDMNIDMTDCLMSLTKIGQENFTNKSLETGRTFTCTTCNKKFPSFQALGGHRASHKKPKFSGDDLSFKLSTSQPKPKAHECPVCGLEFPIGQALGGHMRKHRQATTINKNMLGTKNTSSSVSNSSTVSTGEELATRDFSMAPEVTKKSSCIIFGVDFYSISKEEDLKLEL